MNHPFANRANRIAPSATVALTSKAAELRAQGRDVIALNAGEPDFNTPAAIRQAGIAAIEQGQTKYTAVDGTLELRTAICAKLERDNQLIYQPNQILVSNGAKHSIFNSLLALINTGDEVIIPAPYWVSYPDMVKLADGTPVIVDTQQASDYKLTADQLANAITDKTKLLMLNSPANPTGQAYSKAELTALAEVLLAHPHVYILTDDIYEHIIWHNEGFNNILMVCPELQARTIVINGASKAYAMTGWRMGYAAADSALIATMKKIQGQSTSCPCAISQAAMIEALKPKNFQDVATMVSAFKTRHDFLYQALNQIDGISLSPSAGTFYAFPDITGVLAQLPKIDNDLVFAEQLVEQTGVIVTPGTPFGGSGCLRFSYATSIEILTEAMNRFRDFIQKNK